MSFNPPTIDTGPLHEDWQFLINCCKSHPDGTDIRQMRAYLGRSENLPTTSIMNLALAHGIFPLFYHAIRTHAADLVSADKLAELRQSNIGIAVQNMHTSAELTRILAKLKTIGIQALAFKGPALSQLAYGDITLRQYGDLDILIRKQDISRSLRYLEKDHYRPEIALSDDTEKTFFSCSNVIGLEKTFRIEVHWALLSRNYAINWNEEALWKDIENVVIDTVPIPVPSYHTHLLYLCAHGSKHLFERLEWICDIDRLIRSRQNPGWQSLFDGARVLGIERMLLLGLSLCQKLLALPLPEHINARIQHDSSIAKLERRIIDLHYATPDMQGKSMHSFGLLWQMREKYSDKIHFAWNALFAPKFDDFRYIQLPGYLHFLYPVIRPFRLLSKYW